MSECERCGEAIEGTAVDGLCPRCLLGAAAAVWDDGGMPEVDGYRMIERIGEGGMGEVFLAEQMVPVERLVAVKLVKGDAAGVLERFAQERQALASVEHANVARVLDAGETAGGRPFLVMEFVEGEPVTVYCERRGLGAGARARLMLGVLAAVQHAHQKGVVHRDLKPSNVLACDGEDGGAVAKVIDFGVARLLAPGGGVPAERAVVGTSAYMSPEQAKGEGVDTRADVFALGVLLGEMAGRGGGDLGADLRDIAAKAGADDPELRYRTVAEMADDVRAALSGQVLEAPGAGPVRRVRKYGKRNATALAVLAVIVAGGAFTAVQWDSANRARAAEQAAHGRVGLESDKTQMVSEIVFVIFEDLRLAEEAGPLRDRMQAVLEGLRHAREAEIAASPPEVEFWLRQVWGAAYRGLGDFEAAETELRRVMELIEGEELAVGLAMVAWIEIGLGQSLLGGGKFDEAEGVYENVVGEMMAAPEGVVEKLDLMLALTGLAEAKLGVGKRDEAVGVLGAIEDLGLPEETAQIVGLRRKLERGDDLLD